MKYLKTFEQARAGMIIRVGKFLQKMDPGNSQEELERISDEFIGYSIEYHNDGESFLISPNGERQGFELQELLQFLKK